jgi:hypothetical protein
MSWLFENIIEGSFTWTIPLVFLLIFLDIYLINTIKKRSLLINNRYFELHRRFGILKLNSVKIVFAILNLWQASRPVRYNSLSYFLSLLIYTCIVIKLLLDVLKETKSNKKVNFL